ncbi:predicted protein [Sclerotinia sclerotiorum 1980 UF-70]|uniref:Uncharacterized protein n=1 Tax=Sclerotinia sclerotiorum (strain ATCC 18683 / 1980 / Ss-1) TaxID=665079 RepID=A7EL86_SCLS1|nr:predicted protein [Sclerotinia sclerotiorum 1980 UF-70]EDO03602.1 predicted protein [Sclerotinia sclerotiorum 1980 UF-70]
MGISLYDATESRLQSQRQEMQQAVSRRHFMLFDSHHVKMWTSRIR